MAGILGIHPYCYGSDLSQTSDLSLSLARASSVGNILKTHGIELRESQNPTENLSDEYSRQIREVLEKSTLTGKDEELIGTIYLQAGASIRISRRLQHELEIEGIRHYVKAAALGEDSVIVPLACLFKDSIDRNDEVFIRCLGGKGNVSDTAFRLFELALRCGDESARPAYEYELSLRSSQLASRSASASSSGGQLAPA